MKSITILGVYISTVVIAAVPLNGPTTSLLFYHKNVGIRNAARIRDAEKTVDFEGSRIVGGSAADLREHPWMGGLVITLSDGVTSVCGSSLISNTRAVTAAHCWFDGNFQAVQFIVVLGSLRLFSGGTRIATSEVVTHPSWNPLRHSNNVAVITLDFVSFTDEIQPIALASGNENYLGEAVWAAGYGKQSDKFDVLANPTLHHVEMRVMGNPLCTWSYGSTILDSNICTSGLWDLSICAGDFGGPLVFVNNGTAELVGIASYISPSGCERDLPSVFSRVTSFHSWIVSQM